MRNIRLYGIVGLTAIAAAVAVAQTAVTPLPEATPAESAPLDAASAPVANDPLAELAATHWGDPVNGAIKAGACAACHGLDGNGTDPALYPRLAGQGERYISRQLAMFKSGERVNAIMKPYADALSAQDMRDVAAYFTSKRSGAGTADETVIAEGVHKGLKFYEPGQKLYYTGDASRNIPACFACHGPTGAGNPGAAYPQIGGQQSWYVTRRLEEYRSGTTTEKDPAYFHIMATVAKNLTDEEIHSLASFVQGLHDRGDQVKPGDAPAAAPTPAAKPDADTATAGTATATTGSGG